MADRLSPVDVSFLYLEDPATPMHVGTVAIFEAPADGFDHERLLALLRERIAFVPRYRQRVREIPGYLANPVWIDDEDFDLTNHVRRSAVPRPGTDEQLCELVARLQSRPLDRRRPLWEIYLVEGLADGRFAIVTKSHHALVDGVSAVDIAQVLLDPAPEPLRRPADTWRPAREPTWFELVAGAVSDAVSRPSAVIETFRAGLGDLRSTATRVAGAAGSVVAVARTAARPAPASPLNAETGGQRRFAMLATDLDDYRRIRKAHAATVNDIVLAVVAGALRGWLLTRGEPVTATSTVRALVPVSVRLDPSQATTGPTPASGDRGDGMESVGGAVVSHLVDLPVGEPNPVVRLHQVSYAMRAHNEGGRGVAADTLAGLAGFAPPTLHSLGARVAGGLSRRVFNTVVTNVPGPQVPLYAAGARMLATYPVLPLVRGQALSIGVTSYAGCAYWGLNADRDAMPDLDVLAQCFTDAVAELAGSVA